MIKATLVKDGKIDLLLLGMGFDNLDRLRSGEPIMFNQNEVGLPDLKVMVFAAESETEILNQFTQRGLITEDTNVRMPAE